MDFSECKICGKSLSNLANVHLIFKNGRNVTVCSSCKDVEIKKK